MDLGVSFYAAVLLCEREHIPKFTIFSQRQNSHNMLLWN